MTFHIWKSGRCRNRPALGLTFRAGLRRHATNEHVLALHDGGATIKAIVRGTGIARQTVRRILRGARGDVFRVRTSTLDAWVEPLERGWEGGCRSGAALWRMIKAEGFGGSLRVVSEWARKRRDDAALSGRPRKMVMYNHLVANLLIFHAIMGMTRALDSLAADGHGAAITPEALAGTSPSLNENFNRFGSYELDLSKPPAPLPFALPPQRQPTRQAATVPVFHTSGFAVSCDAL